MLNEELHDILIKSGHPEIVGTMIAEENRQNNTVELIASENFPSEAVRAAAASCFVAKYCEGYPKYRASGKTGRYYGGCENADHLEEYCCQKWREVFNTDYHVNVQPHSGSQANQAAYASVLKTGDRILSMDLNSGGHLSHGSKVNFSGRTYDIVSYGVNEHGLLDYEDLRQKITAYHPKLVIAGGSAYSRIIDFSRIFNIICEVADDINKVAPFEIWDIGRPYFMVDMAHIAGLVVSGDHPSPFGLADIVTTTTHKTLRGTRGGIIFCKPELAKKIDSAVFPGTQGGPLMHIIAAKAVTADEDSSIEFKSYIHRVVKNSKAMAAEFIRLGYDVVTGGTDNHMFLIDFSKTHPNITGAEVQEKLEKFGITLNKNCVPGEKRNPMQTSGVRIGTAAMTTMGYTEKDFIIVAQRINHIINELQKEKNGD
jgi:glycine hydroxymethyltransferase